MRLSRIAGGSLAVAAVVAGVGGAGHAFLSSIGPEGGLAGVGALLAMIANLVVVAAMPAVAVRQTREAGLIGLAGFVLFSFVLMGMGVGMDMIFALVAPALPASPLSTPPAGVMVAFAAVEIAAIVGLTLWGVGTIRARVFPAWTGWAMIASAAVLITADLPFPVAAVTMLAEALHYALFTAALVGVGAMLVRLPVAAAPGAAAHAVESEYAA
ncbi:MAG TPA: hypothetical protein VIA06_02145 [Candidatus Dormibacteraeota bacterium]|jgi:hypothetical protein|nr:hypothetical protein [Candidatus Dormibacteraeota bacterium]